MEYDVTIGLEVHCEVKTNTKMFSPSLNSYEELANNNITEIDLAFPGILPIVNYEAVKKSVKMALALNCKVPSKMYFDRKNYYYPDLPKGFQITQMHDPVGVDGFVNVFVGDEVKKIEIHDIHLEEDTASLDHYDNYSLIDYNRAGIPLLETVTEPCMHSADEALAFLDALRKIFIYCDISEARTDRGQMRCDVNISLAPKGSKVLGTKVEMKNINSFANVKAAIEYEIKRQTEVLNEGGKIIQETRRYDDVDNKTYRMREKVEGVDYKYFIEPNIPPYRLEKEFVEEIKKTIPPLQFERINKYMSEYDISKYDATVIVKDKSVAEYYEKCIELGINPKTSANWVTSIILAHLNKTETAIEELYLTPKMLKDLVKLVEDGKISSKQAKEVFYKVVDDKKDPLKIIDELGIKQTSDDGAIRSIVQGILDNNQKLIDEYKGGRNNVLDFFVGQVMKATRGQANPMMTSTIIKEEIEKR